MKHFKEHQKGTLAIFIAALLWSTGGIFIKLISFGALPLSSLRSFFSAATFFVIFKGKVFKYNKFAVMNALFYAAILVLFVAATKITTAANAIFLQYSASIYVLIFEPIINKTKYELLNVIVIIICFVGMGLFFVGQLAPGHFLGNILALLSGLAFAAFLLGMRKNKPEYQASTIFLGNTLIFLICSPFIFTIVNPSIKDFAMVGYLGIIQIGVAYAFFSFGLKKVLAIEAAIISMIEPVLNPVWVAIGYGEIPTIYSIIGGVIIISAVTIRTIIVEKSKIILPPKK
ncbi:MAG TPA: EamA family transporter [Ignavibacteriaceae bacterium]|nr:EamA family transporter [Ignavibacteriaceae bacterium]